MPQEDLYAVFCGYELDPCDMIREGGRAFPQLIGTDLPFNDAAHILRTLLEKGEGDMSYFMIPARMYAHWSDAEHDTHNGDPEPVSDGPPPPGPLVCTYCSRVDPFSDDALDNWIPYHYARPTPNAKELGPVCPECTSRLLTFSRDDVEHYLRIT